jgi:hypothetical protein
MARMKCNTCRTQFYGNVCPSCGKPGDELPDITGVAAEIGFALFGMTAREYAIQKWREASQDLCFQFISPFTLPDSDYTLAYVGLLPEFGSSRGTLIIDYDDSQYKKFIRVASERGYGYSYMSMSYEPYNREVIIDVLNDWGWCGSPDSKPSWYTGPSEENEDGV